VFAPGQPDSLEDEHLSHLLLNPDLIDDTSVSRIRFGDEKSKFVLHLTADVPG